MKFCDISGPLYLETDASGVRLGARLMQVRDGMNYEEVPDYVTLYPIALASKSLMSAE